MSAEPERTLRIKITAPRAVTAPRPGHWYAYPGEVIEVLDHIANGLVSDGWAELVAN